MVASSYAAKLAQNSSSRDLFVLEDTFKIRVSRAKGAKVTN